MPVSVENISHYLNIIYASAEIDVAMPLRTPDSYTTGTH